MKTSSHFLLLNHEHCTMELTATHSSDSSTPITNTETACIRLNYILENRSIYIDLFNEIRKHTKNQKIHDLCQQLSEFSMYSTFFALELPCVYEEAINDIELTPDILERYEAQIISEDALYYFNAYIPERLQKIYKQQQTTQKLNKLLKSDLDIQSKFNYSAFKKFGIRDFAALQKYITLEYTHMEQLEYWVNTIENNPNYFIDCPRLQMLSTLDKNLSTLAQQPLEPFLNTKKDSFLIVEFNATLDNFNLFSFQEKIKKKDKDKNFNFYTNTDIFYCALPQEATSFTDLTKTERHCCLIHSELKRDTLILHYQGGYPKEFLVPAGSYPDLQASEIQVELENLNKRLDKALLDTQLLAKKESINATTQSAHTKQKFKI